MTYEITVTRLIRIGKEVDRVTCPTFRIDAEHELHARTVVGKILGFPFNVFVELKEIAS